MTDSGNVERIKLRCPVSACLTIRVPAGTTCVEDATGYAYAGQVIVLNNILVVLMETVAVSAGPVTAAECLAAYDIPDIEVPADAADTFVPGGLVYYDLASAQFTVTSTNVTAVGISLEAKATPSVVRIHLCSHFKLATPDVVPTA